MTDGNEPENPSYKLENPKYVLEVLKEYHEQTLEDCRIMGNQKHLILSLFIALGSSIYVLVTKAFSSNTSSLSGYINILSTPLLEIYTILAIFTALILFLCIAYMSISGFIFLLLQLPLMMNYIIKIEELQRDILFKKMGVVDLFSWDEIRTNKSKTFKDYLNQKFIFENIKSINTNLNDHQILIDITKKSIPKKERKSGTLNLDKEKKIAILTVDGIVLDQFNVKEKNSEFILYESEMKYRFRNSMPNFNMLNQSIKVYKECLVYSIIGLAIIWIMGYRYYSVFLFWL